MWTILSLVNDAMVDISSRAMQTTPKVVSPVHASFAQHVKNVLVRSWRNNIVRARRILTNYEALYMLHFVLSVYTPAQATGEKERCYQSP
jgi:hypothetical protein